MRHRLFPREAFSEKLRQDWDRTACFVLSLQDVGLSLLADGCRFLVLRLTQLVDVDKVLSWTWHFSQMNEFYLFAFFFFFFALFSDICWCNCFGFSFWLHSLICWGRNKYIHLSWETSRICSSVAGIAGNSVHKARFQGCSTTPTWVSGEGWFLGKNVEALEQKDGTVSLNEFAECAVCHPRKLLLTNMIRMVYASAFIPLSAVCLVYLN